MKWVKDRTSKRLHCQLNSNANYIRFDWVEFMSTEFFRVIDAINDCYKKMLEIGKCAEVFRPIDGRRPDLLPAKTKKEFMREKENIHRRFNRYVTTGAPRPIVRTMMGPRGAHCTASTSTAGRLRDGYCSQI
jgi:hypothetical protein